MWIDWRSNAQATRLCHKWTLVVLAIAAMILTGCTPPRTAEFRNSNAPFGSTTRFEIQKFEGDWYEVGVIGLRDPSSPQRKLISYRPEPNSVRMLLIDPSRPDCTDNSGQAGCPDGPLTTAIKPTGFPARFGTEQSGVGAQYWVLWTDEGYRAGVMARPDGKFAIVLSRKPELRADLMIAAREVLDFNGYDVTRLQKVNP